MDPIPQRKVQPRRKSKHNREPAPEPVPDVLEVANGSISFFVDPSTPSLASPVGSNITVSGSSSQPKTIGGSTRKRGRKRKKKSPPPSDEPVVGISNGLNKVNLKRGSTGNTAAAQSHAPVMDQTPRPLDTKLRPSGKTADWDEFLSVGYNLHFVAPVSYFKNASLRDVWDDLAIVGKVVEVPNPFIRCPRPINWIATIKHYAGYKALVEFETFGVLPRHAAWMSFCSDVPKPLGYSDKKRILLYPPHVVADRHPDFLDKVRELMKNRETVAQDHGAYIMNQLKKTQKYPLLTMLEVMDRDCASRMRIATVTGTIGNRIHVTYVIEPRKDDVGYWFDVNSDKVHPIGWSQTVDHEIYGVSSGTPFIPLPPEYFPVYPRDLVLAAGQMLEARHPIRPYLICAASVNRVMNYGYFVAEFRTSAKEKDHPIVFTFHVTSPFVFPCGFCEANDIALVPPFGEDKSTFQWKKYLEQNMYDRAPLDLIPPRDAHKFKPGMKLEACGILDPTYLGPATIRRVRAHLLYLSFDGWPNSKACPGDTQMWTHAESSEIYPIGYCEMVGHNFQGKVQCNNFNDIEEQFSSRDSRKSGASAGVAPSSRSASVLD